MNFAESLQIGQAAESAIAKWLISKGRSVMPVYEKIIDTGKGPQLFCCKGSYAAPDLAVFSPAGEFFWVEAKHKTAFTWWRKGGVFETGVDLKHYQDYISVSETTKKPVWIFFLHKGGKAKDSPASPSGLYGGSLEVLRRKESHRHSNWGKSGMVYWARDVDGGCLKKLAEYNEIAKYNERTMT